MNEFYVPCAAFMVARPTGVRSDDVRRRTDGVPNARKMDGSELRNTLGKGAEVQNEVRKQGEMWNV